MEPYERRRSRRPRHYTRKSYARRSPDAVTSPVVESLGVIAIGAALIVGASPGHLKSGSIGPFQFTGPADGSRDAAATVTSSLAAIADPVRKNSIASWTSQESRLTSAGADRHLGQ